MNNPIEAPQQFSDSTFLQWLVGLTLLAVGFRIGYCTDTDWDRDGISNEVELKCHLNPHKADSDSNGVKDGDEIFTCFLGTPATSSNTSLADTICLTALKGAKKICFHPADVLLFECTQGRNLKFDWQGDAEYVRENLTEIHGKMEQIGYNQYARVSRQDLANLLLAECFDSKNNRLYLSLDDNIWCEVSGVNAQMLKGRVNPCDNKED